ncbi:MAG: DUF4430 domain-containing protein [Eubacteriaceae bacterium]|nr:DUF4430 domain-containing protein [Eubacteriaceae bacterium]
MDRNTTNIIAVALVAALIFGAFAAFAPSERVEPERPAMEEVKPLGMQTVTGEAASEGLNPDETSTGDSSSQGGSDSREDSDVPNPDTAESGNSTQKPDTPQQNDPKEPQPADPNQDNPTPSDGGQSGTDEPGTGEDPSGGGNSGGEDPGGSDEDGLVTDLVSRTITFSELVDDTLEFYAYYSDPKVNANIRVTYRHESDSGNGMVLKGRGSNYETTLQLGRNYINISFTDKNGVRNYTRFIITYAAEKADGDNPVIGANPPDIVTNLDDWEGYIENDRFTFQVTATDYKGEPIYSNHIVVTLDGTVITNPTGRPTYEYMLYFKQPNVGNVRDYRVGVLAWDDEGNSRYKELKVQYYHKDDGFSAGYVTVVLDATTVGMGIFEEPITVELLKGENAAETLLKALDEYGYSYTYAGTVKLGFYLRSLERAGSFPRYVMIPDELLAAIQRDGIDIWLDSRSRDSLSEYDYTRGSGWVYAVNGYYPGKGMSEYFLSDGDTLTLRFTLAYGKDIGAAGGTSGTGGRYSSYCGMWINGGFIPFAHRYAPKERVEPTCTTEGYVINECTVCGEQKKEVLPVIPHKGEEQSRQEPTCEEEGWSECICDMCGETYREVLPAAGHEWEETGVTEATCLVDGHTDYVCAKCGEEKSETIPAPGHSGKETERVEADCTNDGYIEYRCEVCGEYYREILESSGHSWKETGRTEPGCTVDGHVDYVCEACGETRSEVLEATGHSWVETGRDEPGCEYGGYAYYRCEVCGETESRYLEATGHSYRETDRVEPTETEDGYIEYTCSVCGDSYRVTLDRTGTDSP